MNINALRNTYSTAPGETSDRHIRGHVRAVEERLVGMLRGVLKPGFESTCGEDLHLELPDESFQTWMLGFQRLDGEWRLVVLEENSQVPARDVVTVAPTVPLADAGLAPLLFFSPYLEAFVEQVVDEARRSAKRARKRSKRR
jgi:hypothetical protein